MPPRLYLPAVTASRDFQLDAAQSRHLIKVLRLKQGEKIEVFDGAGGAFEAHIIDDHKNHTVIQTAADALPAPAATDAGRRVHIGQVVRQASAKTDWAIEKMTELGAASITLLEDNRNKEKSKLRALSLTRWRRLIIAACEQCGRNTLPQLQQSSMLSGWQPPCSNAIVLTPRAPRALFSVLSSLPANGAIALAIGGESGFNCAEEEQLITAGFQPAHLGARILRTETAGLAALALIAAIP